LCAPRLPSGMCALCACSTPRLQRRIGHARACTRRMQHALRASVAHCAFRRLLCARSLCSLHRSRVCCCRAVAAMRRRAPGSGSTTATTCSWTLTRRRVTRTQDSCEQRASHTQLISRVLPSMLLAPRSASAWLACASRRAPSPLTRSGACGAAACMHSRSVLLLNADAVTHCYFRPLARHGAAFCRRWRAACLARRSRPWSWWCALTPPARSRAAALSCASPQSHILCRRRRCRLRARPCGSSVVQHRPFADAASRSCVVFRHLCCARASQGDMSCDGGTGMGLLSWWT
jgi:hypothetical protein